jgi:hypothetical protein
MHMRPEYEQGKQAGLAPENYPFVDSHKLAQRLASIFRAGAATSSGLTAARSPPRVAKKNDAEGRRSPPLGRRPPV